MDIVSQPGSKTPFSPLWESWTRCCVGLGMSEGSTPWFERLLACYSEPQRHYHTLQHLMECLSHFERVRHLARRPAEIEFGLWFHDAIYQLRDNSNEANSADLAIEALRSFGAMAEVRERVRGLIMATRHSALPVLDDEQLLVDIDLSILGADATRFAEYEMQIREEYAFVPAWLFRSKRRKILRGFLDRAQIYSTPHFQVELELRARANLKNALEHTRS